MDSFYVLLKGIRGLTNVLQFHYCYKMHTAIVVSVLQRKEKP